MLSYFPRFAIATLEPPQTRLMPKLGGLPWGFPPALWRRCADCGEPLALLAQLPHEAPALDLGDSRWVLHLFQCATPGCFTWDHARGCNAALVLPRAALGEGFTRPPRRSPMHGEVLITGWDAQEDGVPAHLRPAFFDHDAFHALPEELRARETERRRLTKAGSVPYWTVTGPSALPALPPAPFEYLLQIDTFLHIAGPLPTAAAIGCDIDRERGVRHLETLKVPDGKRAENAPWEVHQDLDDGNDAYYVTFANFGSDGTAYVFIDRQAVSPRALLFWNR